VSYVCLSECDGGRIWTRCSAKCVITCDNYAQIMPCPMICRPGCSCPYSRPVWHRGQCVTRDQCKGSSIQLRFCVWCVQYRRLERRDGGCDWKQPIGGLTAQVVWLGLRVVSHLALSLHSSGEPGELSQWLWAMMTAPKILSYVLLVHPLCAKRRRGGLVFCYCFNKYFTDYFRPVISTPTGPIFTKFARLVEGWPWMKVWS